MAWWDRGGRAEKDMRGGQRISMKFLQAGSCLPDLPEMPAPTVCEETYFPLGHSHSKWKPTHVLDQFFQLWKRPPNILWLADHKSRIPAIMMMIIALVIAAMQLLLSLVHLQSLLGIGSVLRIVLAPAFKSNRLTQVNPTRWDPACWMDCQVWGEGFAANLSPRGAMSSGCEFRLESPGTRMGERLFYIAAIRLTPLSNPTCTLTPRPALPHWLHCPEQGDESATHITWRRCSTVSVD